MRVNVTKNVYVLIQEFAQDDFRSRRGETARPEMLILGIFSRKNEAIRQMNYLVETNKADVEEYGAEPCEFYILTKEMML